MTITPDQARELLDGARPGPWYVHTVPDDPDGTFIYDDMGRMCIAVEPAGSDYLEADLTLTAAAPDLAQTIAALRWEYAVETMVEGEWEDIWDLWSTEKEARKEYADLIHDDEDGDYRLVRRLVSPVEVVE